MKIINSGLAVLALAASGCGTATLRDFEARELPSERININGDYFHCRDEHVDMDSGGYWITCNGDYGRHEFESIARFDRLIWDGIDYYDTNHDGRLDFIAVKGEVLQINCGERLSRCNEYSETLRMLKQPEINRIWQERWGNE